MPAAPPLILANANAGGGTALADLRAATEALADRALLRITHSPHEAKAALRTHWADGTRRFVAAGGDGTLHLLVNTLHNMGVLPQVDAVGLAPVGTGNDLARSLALPESLPEALRLACTAPPCPMDVLAIQNRGVTERLALNVCVGGFGGYIDKALSRGPKSLLGPLAYVMGAAQVLPKLRRYDLTLTLDGTTVSRPDVLNVVVANAATAAGGMEVAPGADPFDGQLNVVTVRAGSPSQITSVVQQVLTGCYTNHPLVTAYTAQSIQVETDPPLVCNADGELLSYAPDTFVVKPGLVPMVALPSTTT
ncbi:diacylglycerol/lipid kinase family protein [Longimonas halophila]|nr:diacylglycerol kinase family protein [Longimonas halophila]